MPLKTSSYACIYFIKMSFFLKKTAIGAFCKLTRTYTAKQAQCRWLLPSSQQSSAKQNFTVGMYRTFLLPKADVTHCMPSQKTTRQQGEKINASVRLYGIQMHCNEMHEKQLDDRHLKSCTTIFESSELQFFPAEQYLTGLIYSPLRGKRQHLQSVGRNKTTK